MDTSSLINRGALLLLLMLPAINVDAAIVVRPLIDGYSVSQNGGSARYVKRDAGTIGLYNKYSDTGKFSVNGRSATLPARIPLATNVGGLIKSAIRLNPLILAGTLAYTWLESNDISYDGQWLKNDGTGDTQPSTGYIFRSPVPQNSPWHVSRDSAASDYINHLNAQNDGYTYSFISWDYPYPESVMTYRYIRYDGNQRGNLSTTLTAATGCATGYTLVGSDCIREGSVIPMTTTDWDALPDPTIFLAPETPNVLYLPDGSYVSTPEYDPGDITLGPPYTKPDGSTVQPRAKITPNGDGTVTVDTYDQPLTDPSGVAVPEGSPVYDTPETSPQTAGEEPPPDFCVANPTAPACRDVCLDNPDRAGCINLGEPISTAPLIPDELSLEFAADTSAFGGSCPSPRDVLGRPLSFQPACDAMSLLKPFILAFAWFGAALIAFGVFS